MHPYYPPGDQKQQLNSSNMYGYNYLQPVEHIRNSFPNPNLIQPPLQRGIYGTPMGITRPPNSMTFSNNQSVSFGRSNQLPASEDPRYKKEMTERMLKERNYQQQQQRLRDFNPSQSSKLKADKLIENVIGKLGHEPNISAVKDVQGLKPKTNFNSAVNAGAGVLSGGKTVTKARDWSNFGDLEQVFASSEFESNSELPLWCRVGNTTVPAAYLEVERCVLRDGKIDTGLVYPLLLSSGLSRETLGRLWAMANKETPGTLNRSEFYAVLGMIALVQNSREVNSISILNTVLQPPIPILNVVSNIGTHNNSSVGLVQQQQLLAQQPIENNFDDFDDFQSAALDVVPSVPVPAASISVGSRLANYDLTWSQKRGASEFIEAKPQETNFKQEEATTKNEAIKFNYEEVKPKCEELNPVIEESKISVEQSQLKFEENEELDLMDSIEDKYNIFRLIETPCNQNEDDFGNFMFSNESKIDVEPMDNFNVNLNDDFDDFQSSVVPIPSIPSKSFAAPELQADDDDDDFGDFAAADVISSEKEETSIPDSSGPSPFQSEVQSVASLDLGLVDTRSSTPPSLTPMNYVLKTDSFAADFITDRYSFLKKENEQSENSHAYEWRRCLENCFQLIKNAMDTFNSGSSSVVCYEVISCEEGENYIKSIIEIYRVACRISRWIGLIEGEDGQALESTITNIENEWNRLLPFIVASPLVPSEKKSVCWRRDQNSLAPLKPCGVCLMDVEHCDEDCAPNLNFAQLTYAGRTYHVTCANFWVNCVDSKLPSLPVLL